MLSARVSSYHHLAQYTAQDMHKVLVLTKPTTSFLPDFLLLRPQIVLLTLEPSLIFYCKILLCFSYMLPNLLSNHLTTLNYLHSCSLFPAVQCGFPFSAEMMRSENTFGKLNSILKKFWSIIICMLLPISVCFRSSLFTTSTKKPSPQTVTQHTLSSLQIV